MKKVLVLILLVILSGCSYEKEDIKTFVSQLKNESVEHIKEEMVSIKKNGEENKELPKEEKSGEINIYKNDQANFSLSYPGDVKLGDKPEKNSLVLNIEVKNIKKDEVLGLSSDDLVILAKNMKRGEFADISGWTLENSEKIFNIGENVVEEGVIFSKYEVCDIVFERNLTFFKDNYLVNISLLASKDNIVEENSEYFQKDSSNCFDEKRWYFERQGEFYSKLESGDIGGVAQEWFDTFDSIISSLDIGESQQNSGLNDKIKVSQLVLGQQNSGLNLVWPQISGIDNKEVYNKIIGELDFGKNVGQDLDKVEAQYSKCRCGLVASSYAVNYNQNEILSISLILDYIRSYPSEIIKNYVFDLESGEKLEINSLIKEEKQSELVEVCNQKLQENIQKAIENRNQKNLDIPLDKFKGEFKKENFANYVLSDKGLEFFYDFDFEQASKAFAPSSYIFVSFEEINKDFFLKDL